MPSRLATQAGSLCYIVLRTVERSLRVVPEAIAVDPLGIADAQRPKVILTRATRRDQPLPSRGHGGYLLDQFLQDGSNQRTDTYGGSAENRARLLLEVTAAAVSIWGSDRVGVRMSPGTKFNGMSDSNPDGTFGYAAEQLNRFGLAYLHLIEPRIKGNVLIEDGLPPVAAAQMRKIFKSKIIAAGGFEPDTAEAIVEKGDADLVAFGRHFIANPDLPKRIKLRLPLNRYDRKTFYGGDAHGYTDYPFYSEPAVR